MIFLYGFPLFHSRQIEGGRGRQSQRKQKKRIDSLYAGLNIFKACLPRNRYTRSLITTKKTKQAKQKKVKLEKEMHTTKALLALQPSKYRELLAAVSDR